MAKIFSIASGSKGNCTYIGRNDGGILVDAGVSCAKITKSLSDNGIDISKIHGIFVTHEHIDHISGIKVFASKNNLPVYMTKGTLKALGNGEHFDNRVDCRVIDKNVALGNFEITSFKTSHDTPDSCGYVINTGNEKIAVCTDTGFVSDSMHNALSDCRAVVIESNHDINMLTRNMKYPLSLKRRIMSDNGHLSNVDCAEEIAKLVHSGAVHFILAHLSEENNTPATALASTKTRLMIEGMKLDCDYTLNVANPCDNRIITV